ncbi:hypothetical protein BH09PSE6_BH09PSE6_20800 [soil metagenome]
MPEDLSVAESKSLILRAVTHSPAQPYQLPAEEVGMAYFDRKTVRPLAASLNA